MHDSLDKQQTVVTPEQVQLQFQTAGIGSRAMAHLLDVLILVVIHAGIFFALVGLASLAEEGQQVSSGTGDYATAILIILIVLFNVGYFICTEYYMGGQTPGKRVFGLRVLQDNGQSATFLSVIIRNFFRLLDMLPSFYFLGVTVMLFSKKDKRVGDMVAGTMVVLELQKERAKRRKAINKAMEPWQSRLPDLNVQEGQKQLFNAKDWLMLSTWAESLPSMPTSRLEELGKPIAAYLAAKLQHPPEATVSPQAYLIALYTQLRDDWEL